MQMNIDVVGVLFIPVLTLVLAVVCYGYARAVRRGQPLTVIQKRMIVYACLFCLGMGYAMVLRDQLALLLHLERAWVVATVGWGVIVGAVAWLMNRKNVKTEKSGDIHGRVARRL